MNVPLEDDERVKIDSLVTLLPGVAYYRIDYGGCEKQTIFYNVFQLILIVNLQEGDRCIRTNEILNVEDLKLQYTQCITTLRCH